MSETTTQPVTKLWMFPELLIGRTISGVDQQTGNGLNSSWLTINFEDGGYVQLQMANEGLVEDFGDGRGYVPILTLLTWNIVEHETSPELMARAEAARERRRAAEQERHERSVERESEAARRPREIALDEFGYFANRTETTHE